MKTTKHEKRNVVNAPKTTPHHHHHHHHHARLKDEESCRLVRVLGRAAGWHGSGSVKCVFENTCPPGQACFTHRTCLHHLALTNTLALAEGQVLKGSRSVVPSAMYLVC